MKITLTGKEKDFSHYDLLNITYSLGAMCLVALSEISTDVFFCVLQVRCKNHVEVLKAPIELLNLCSFTYINF